MVPAKNLRRQDVHPSCPEWTSLLGGSNTDENYQDWNGGNIGALQALLPLPQGHRHPGGSCNPQTINYT